MKAMIPVENGQPLAALQRFLQGLLEKGVVEALLVPMRTPRGAVTPALVSSPELLSAADPLAPVMPSNAATLAGKLSVREPRPQVGVVLRSCELRALVELVKLRQADITDLTLIAVDCAGTFSVPEYTKMQTEANGAIWRELFTTASQSPENTNDNLRLACRMCEAPIYEEADISIELLSSELDRALVVSLSDDLAETLQLSKSESTSNQRNEIVTRFIQARKATRDVEFAAIRKRLENEESIIGVFDACIRCHNCMTVCPVCYCKTCVFKSPVFDHEPPKYINWARQKGAFRLPADTALFHLTRLNHMGLSCVGCGMCTQACPADLPVGTVFRAIGERLQAAFGYVPGRSVDELLPLVTFKEDEWTELGEE
jgi:formate dehydrogenase subunit beta